jgi:lysyl-tRNA synthetase class 2
MDEQSELQESQTQDHISEVQLSRIRNLEIWQDAGLAPYADKVEVTSLADPLQNQYAHLESGEETADGVTIAGRIMALRNSGMFMDVQDHSGKIQVFNHKAILAPECMQHLKVYDLGDVIAVTGKIRRTQRGELTVNSEHIQLLSKSLQPLPEKYHGLSDIEIRYRKRHIDLTVNPDSKNVFIKRSQILTAIRSTFIAKGFLEVETPMLHPIPGGATAKPFVTHHNALNQDLFFRIAPELYLKRLIIGGISDRVFEIGRCFRNEGLSPKHNPEFTSVEAYQAHADYTDMMTLVEHVIAAAAKVAHDGQTRVTYGDREIDFAGPWPRKTMVDLVQEATGLDFLDMPDPLQARRAALELGVEIEDDANWGQIVAAIFDEKVEHKLVQPIHVIDFPRDISPLAKVKPAHPLLTERFESYANGWELANAFSELNDPFDQYQRFKAQDAQRVSGDDEAHYFDEDYIEALEFGMPPTGGLGIGIDRVVMLLTNSPNIKDVIAFPTLRPAKASSLVRALDEASQLHPGKQRSD